LVTGELAPLARLHPPIKGFESTGSSIVSFNADAYTSYKGSIEKIRARKKENDSGANAPISVQAAFSYTTVLNHLLRRESRQKLRIGDATVVFWAEAADTQAAAEAESLLAAFFDPRDEDERATKQVHDVLEQVRQGLPLHDLEGHLDDGTRIFVLGLAPNASRLSIRFWETQTLATFAQRLRWHFDDLRLEPPAWRTPPAVWKLLLATVPHHEGAKPKSEDVPPQLAGELTRAVLTGRRYPRSLLSNIIMRFRADGDISGTRVALCKGVLAREQRLDNKDTNQGELLVSLDVTNTDPGYLLGRLFSTLENVQRAALGKQINATIRDRYYGAASATPASVFPVLLRNAQHHLSRVRKEKPGFAVNLEKDVGGIIDQLGPTFPKSLRIEAQGHFAIGYYHQTQARFSRADPTDTDSEGEDA
jgi:CRISPR-associated protein Csd1